MPVTNVLCCAASPAHSEIRHPRLDALGSWRQLSELNAVLVRRFFPTLLRRLSISVPLNKAVRFMC